MGEGRGGEDYSREFRRECGSGGERARRIIGREKIVAREVIRNN